jgi:tetratricopeptide (TPR) repeat protein
MTTTKAFIALSCLFLVPVGRPNAQSLSCDRDDYRCLQREYESVCREPRFATRESCADWVQRLESHPFAMAPDWRLIAAAAYGALADFSGSPERATQFRREETTIYRDLIAQNPRNVQALIGLSAVVDDSQERIDLLRRAIVVDPNNRFALKALVSDLAASGSEGEAAPLLERAYTSAKGRAKWKYAFDALLLYRRIGNSDAAERLRGRVLEDIGLTGSENEVATRDFTDLVVASTTLSSVCDESVIYILGAATCLEAIESALQTIENSAALEQRTALADILMSAMLSAGRSGTVQTFEPSWRSRFQRNVESVLASGVESGTIYDAYASFVASPEARLMALEKAAALAPADGQIVYRLGLAYLELHMEEEGIEFLRRARPLLPEWRHEVLDEHIRRAEAQLESEKP